jgi:ABC-type transport system involved in multi-copper enzyme maturation permease subunit
MLLGPVFRAELIRTARKRYSYLLRVLYGSGLLLLLWLNYEWLVATALMRGGKPLIPDFADFALRTFVWFAVVQLGTILVLVPALFAGVIADEKQRKTLHYLMASRLTSGEIILDKLAARLLHLGSFVLLGLPVMSLLTLFGGVAWDYVLGGYSATCSITFFAASLAVLVSTFARRVRGAVLITYVLQAAWLIVPPLADPVCRFVFPQTYRWFGPVNEWLMATTPLSIPLSYMYLAVPRPPGRFPGAMPPSALVDQLAWMVGLEFVLGILFLAIAAWRLRPTFRRQEESRRWLTWFSPEMRRPRWLRRPECGADAMLWKERHFARTDVFTKLVVLPATIVLSVCVILGGGFDEKVVRSFDVVWQHGYNTVHQAPSELNGVLCSVSPLYIGLWLLAVAGAAASSVTVEREQGTWDVLISTCLTGGQILRGKAIGAVWGLRGFGALLSLFWLVGLAAGAVHPLGLLLALFVVGLLTWFVVALGTYASLIARSTARALTATLVILFFLNLGYMAIAYPLLWFVSQPPAIDSDWRYLPVGCTPLVASYSLLSYPQLARILQAHWAPEVLSVLDVRAIRYATMVLAAYAAAAALLTWRSFRRFDKSADRPRSDSKTPDRIAA